MRNGGRSLCARGDKPGLIDAWSRYARYFEGLPDKEDFFPTHQKYIVREIPDAVRLVQKQENSGFRRLQWKLRLQRFWSQQIRAKSKKVFRPSHSRGNCSLDSRNGPLTVLQVIIRNTRGGTPIALSGPFRVPVG